MNERYSKMRAVPIPEIPQLLGEKYVFDRFKGSYDTVKQIIGIGYETVSPIVYEIPKNNLLAVCGGENTGKANFLKYILHSMQRTHSDIEPVYL